MMAQQDNNSGDTPFAVKAQYGGMHWLIFFVVGVLVAGPLGWFMGSRDDTTRELRGKVYRLEQVTERLEETSRNQEPGLVSLVSMLAALGSEMDDSAEMFDLSDTQEGMGVDMGMGFDEDMRGDSTSEGFVDGECYDMMMNLKEESWEHGKLGYSEPDEGMYADSFTVGGTQLSECDGILWYGKDGGYDWNTSATSRKSDTSPYWDKKDGGYAWDTNKKSYGWDKTKPDIGNTDLALVAQIRSLTVQISLAHNDQCHRFGWSSLESCATQEEEWCWWMNELISIAYQTGRDFPVGQWEQERNEVCLLYHRDVADGYLPPPPYWEQRPEHWEDYIIDSWDTEHSIDSWDTE